MNGNDERQQKRVQASLKVRYKSATVTEFIEKHSHDISVGGVFIRAKKPLAKGSLLKIDFRLEDDTTVIKGVGRVVWTREQEDETDKPSGMGIKFIRLDEQSKKNIANVVSSGKSMSQGMDDDDGDAELLEGESASESVAPSLHVDMDADDSIQDAPTQGEVKVEDDKEENEVTRKIGFDSISMPPASSKNSAVASGSSSTVEPKEGSRTAMIVILLLLLVLVVLVYVFTRTGDVPAQDPTDNNAVVSVSDVSPKESSAPTPEVEPVGQDDSTVETDSQPAAEAALEPVAKISGAVSILTNIEGATVVIDGEIQEAKTPFKIASLPVGQHQLQVKMFGYKSIEHQITLEESVPFDLQLKMDTARIIVQIKANVFGAKVFMGKKQIGRTPIKTVKRLNESFDFVVKKLKYEDLAVSVVPADWTYEEKGVYSLIKEVTLIEKRAAPKDAQVVTPSKAPVERGARSKRKSKKIPAARKSTPQKQTKAAATNSSAKTSARVPSSASAVPNKTAKPKANVPAAGKAPAVKPVVKAAGADENPY